MTERSPKKLFNGYHWLLLIMLLLQVGSTTAIPEETLPNLGSNHPLSKTTPLLSSEQQMALLLKQSATVLTSAHPRQQATTFATQKAYRLINQGTERWFSQFGRARVNLGSDSRFKRFEGELALLLPLDESCSRPLTFSQLGLHHYHGQPVANLGVGQRYLMQKWLWGYNAFLDQNLRRPHSRLGVGAELWRDYLKLSGNGYFAVSRWKNSKKVDGYQEKVASGFDLRAQGYWPTHPQLSAHLLFENYFGDQVALFDKRQEDWQKNPLAATLGIQYTPVPLFTVGVDHKIGRQSRKETRFTLQFDYLLDLPWEYQITPGKVAAQRALPISQYDWVQRNNRLVLQYRQLAPISLTLPLPAQLVGFPEETIPLGATVEARFGFKEIHWNSEALTTAGGKIEQVKDTLYRVILPKNPGRYPLSGIAVDQQGNQSTTASTEITVKQHVTLTLPAQLIGSPKEKLTLNATVEAHFGFKQINWNSEKLTAAGGSIKQLAGSRYEVTLPEAIGRYPLLGIAEDQRGNQSDEATTELVVSDITLTLPEKVIGIAGKSVDLPIKVSTSNGFGEIRWKADDFKKDGGEIYATPGEEHELWMLKLPNQEKTYVITGIVVDQLGHQSLPATVSVVVKKELPELKIQGPTAKELPATWLDGETLQLTATGGEGQYQWRSSNIEAATVQDKGDGQCKVTIVGRGPVTIQVTSAGTTVAYTELEKKRPLLKAMDDTERDYLEAEALCSTESILPGRSAVEAILQSSEQKQKIKTWAETIFGEKKNLTIWLQDSGDGSSGRPSMNLVGGTYEGSTDANLKFFTICQF